MDPTAISVLLFLAVSTTTTFASFTRSLLTGLITIHVHSHGSQLQMQRVLRPGEVGELTHHTQAAEDLCV